MLLYIIWNIEPIIYTIRISELELPITWYGLSFALAFILGQQVFTRIFRAEGKSVSDVESLTLYVVIATVVGARLGHFLFYEWESLFSAPGQWLIALVTPPFAGLASHGAVISILISLYLYSRKKSDQTFLWVLDRVVIAGCFAGLIRLGNLLNSEIYGTPTSLPWAFMFVRETDPSLLPVVPRHPTQIYELLFCVLLFFITYGLWKYRRNILPQGFITSVFIIGLFTFRFLIEFLKNNQSSFEKGMGLNMGQILSIPIVAAGVITLFLVYAKKRIEAKLINVTDS